MNRPARIALLTCLSIAEFAAFLTCEGCSRRVDDLGGPGDATSSPAPVGFTLDLDPQMHVGGRYRVLLKSANGPAVQRLLQQELDRLDEVNAEPLRAIESQISARLSGQGFDISALDPEDRPLVDEGESEWTWQIIPKFVGKGVLTATVRLNSLEKRPTR